jgi:cytoskeleton protein RodZ
MQEENNNNKTFESSDKSVSIGALLINARNAASLNQADIAEQINLPKHIIQSLESDDYSSLPETTYIRGYLRNYARVVGINGEGLVKLYVDQHYSEPVVQENRKSKQSYDPAILWSTAAVLTILVGLVVTWWLDNNPISDSVEQLAQQTAQQTTQPSAHSSKVNEAILGGELSENKNSDQQASQSASTNDNVVSDNETSLSTAIVDEAHTEQIVSSDDQEAMAEASRNPTLLTSLDGVQVLTVTYTEESWTEIIDSDANTLMQGLIEPGVVRNLSGKPPFEIFLGNSPGVIIEVNGLYFDHSQYSRNNRTARFQVSSGSLN